MGASTAGKRSTCDTGYARVVGVRYLGALRGSDAASTNTLLFGNTHLQSPLRRYACVRLLSYHPRIEQRRMLVE